MRWIFSTQWIFLIKFTFYKQIALTTNGVLLLVGGAPSEDSARARLLYTHCRDKSQRWRTAGCNKVYFSRYYVKLASLAELELFKKHSAAVVAVGSLNMHGGKCPRPPDHPPPPRPPTNLPHPRAFLCLRMLPSPSPPFRACNYPMDVAECRR